MKSAKFALERSPVEGPRKNGTQPPHRRIHLARSRAWWTGAVSARRPSACFEVVLCKKLQPLICFLTPRAPSLVINPALPCRGQEHRQLSVCGQGESARTHARTSWMKRGISFLAFVGTSVASVVCFVHYLQIDERKVHCPIFTTQPTSSPAHHALPTDDAHGCALRHREA